MRLRATTGLNMRDGGRDEANRKGRLRRVVIWMGILLAGGVSLEGAASAAALDVSKWPAAAMRKVDFAKDIEPIFAEHCYGCHGAKRSESGLRLDRRTDALKGGDHGALWVVGKSVDSGLIQVLVGAHAEVAKMPKKGDPLTEGEVGLIRAWIDQGAAWPETGLADASMERQKNHWAFRSPTRPVLPDVKQRDRVRNPIDAFLLARLEKENVGYSQEADRITLLRRLSLDLTGLPPTIEEVDAFVADTSERAYEKQVERLLASPHYGERWGRHWLDAARYADTDGFEKDKSRFIWFYRDWVIQAFNRDLPYDQFVIEQLAGDQLPNATQDQVVATGFLRNSMINEEGGIDPEQFRMDGMFDRMDALGKSVLGLTIQCAQCHTHKYDPITQEEYYRMFAFLNNDHEGTQVVYTPEQLMKMEGLRREMRELELGLQHRSPNWEMEMAQWEERVRGDQPEWQVQKMVNSDDGSQRYIYHKDGSVVAAGYAPTQWTSHFTSTNGPGMMQSVRLEYLTDPNLPSQGPGRSIKGMCALSQLTLEVVDATNPTNKYKVKWAKVTADYANAEKPLEAEFDNRSGKKRVYGPVEYAIDDKEDTAWGIDAGPGRRNQDRKAVFVADKPFGFPSGTILRFHFLQNHGGWNSDDNQNHNLGRFRVSVSGASNAVADPLPRVVREILSVPSSQRTASQRASAFSYWRTTVDGWKDVNERIEGLWKQWPEGATTMVLASRDEPRMTSILKRGDWLKPGRGVTPGVPAFLHPLQENAPPTRLTLARWLVDRKSPTTARVFVNRMWQHYFGTGIVSTSEDFGIQSDKPSHPELLDWLACEFMDRGWSIKEMHRLIVNSSAYRQSSRVSRELLEKDPFNRWLARGARFRVEGEIVRDVALAASGLLNPALGGEGIFTPAPRFLFQPPASYGPFEWKEEAGADRYRRAIYTFRRRSTPYPALQTFDVPNADFSCVRRTRSNTPLQALTTLNETLFVEAAQALARVTLEKGGSTDESRITYAFRRVLSRPPTDSERQRLQELLERQRRRISEGWVNAWELATGKNELSGSFPEATNPTLLAAYTTVSRVLLNLDETITKE